MKDSLLDGIYRRLIPNSKDITARYEKIYGGGNYDKEYQDYYIKQTQLIKVALIACITLIGAVIVQSFTGGCDVTLQNGTVKAIAREDQIMRLPLTIEIQTDSGSYSEDVMLTIENVSNQPSDADNAQREPKKEDEYKLKVQEAMRIAENSPAKDEVILPDSLADGTQIKWHINKDYSSAAVLLLIPALLIFIRSSRYTLIDKLQKESTKSIMMELPDFISNFALLLNSGLVQSAAFTKIVDERVKDSNNYSSYFYERLGKIAKNSKETNMYFEYEFIRFAKSSGVREFIRIANIIGDNLDKGTALAQKLENESSMLWFSRKKHAEEDGRMAETKLTIPLMILLLVLIMVTIAPAMLQM